MSAQTWNDKFELPDGPYSVSDIQYNGDNVPHSVSTEVIVVHCHIVNNNYLHDLIVVYVLVPNQSFDQLLDISPKKFIFLEILIQNFHILNYGLLIKF